MPAKSVSKALGLKKPLRKIGEQEQKPAEPVDIQKPGPMSTPTGGTLNLPPQMTPQQRLEQGNAFIRSREKALNKGMSMREANAAAQMEASQIGTQRFDPVAVQRRNEALEQIGQAGSATMSPESPGIENALVGGLIGAGSVVAGGALAGAVSGAATGAAAGSVVPGAGTAVGAVGGFVAGFGGALIKDARQSVKQEFNTFTNSRNNLQKIVDAANAGMDPLEAVRLYNQELTKIATARAELKLKTDNSVTNFLGQPGDELQDIENFYTVEFAMYNEQMAQAIAMPDPNKLMPQTQFSPENI